MNDFNPGPGWRELDPNEKTHDGEEYLRLGQLYEIPRIWIRVPRADPLPTVPYTVIAAVGEGFQASMVLRQDGSWRTVSGRDIVLRPEDGRILKFEVLSEPVAK